MGKEGAFQLIVENKQKEEKIGDRIKINVFEKRKKLGQNAVRSLNNSPLLSRKEEREIDKRLLKQTNV